MLKPIERDSQESGDELSAPDTTKEILALRKWWGAASILPAKHESDELAAKRDARSKLRMMRVPRSHHSGG